MIIPVPGRPIFEITTRSWLESFEILERVPDELENFRESVVTFICWLNIEKSLIYIYKSCCLAAIGNRRDSHIGNYQPNWYTIVDTDDDYC